MAKRAVGISQSKPMSERNVGTERMTQLHIVRAHIDLNELDAAAVALSTVLETPVDARPAPLLLQLAEITTRMRPALRHSSDGRRIGDAIGAFRAATPWTGRRALDDGRDRDT